jgi:hypothetical protein
MRNIRINIEGQQVDYDLQNLPLTFTRRLDLWDKFIGSEGDRPKPLGDTLYLPATKRNSLVMDSFDNLNTTARIAQGRLIIEVLINGASVFVGFAQRISISKDHKLAKVFALKIVGEASSLFKQMNETSLRALDMGEADTESVDITDSWVDITVTGNPLIWAPIYYGGSTSIDTFVIGSGYRYIDGFRPCVRIWKIVEAIFAGYQIVSTMYESQMFRNLVYPFAVGDDWERNDSVEFYRCYVGDGTGEGIQSFSPPTTVIKWVDEAPPFSDPANLNDGLGNFSPAAYGAGWYQFTFRVDSNADNLQIIGTYPFGTQVLYEFPNTELALVTTVEPILFEPSSPQGLISIKFVLNKAVGNIDIFGQATYSAQLLQRFAYGQPLRIASCLHDKTQSAFWRGLQHAFGLVLAIDEVAKQVYFEPRFNNITNPFVNPEPPTTRLDCWYNGQVAQELQADISEVFVQHKRPFGDYLDLAYAESSSDALYTYIKEQAAGEYDDKPLLGSRIDFVPTDTEGTTLRNPFFTYLPNIRIQSSDSDEGRRLGVFPCIVDNLELLTQDFGKQIQPTFKGDPKLALYYGLLDFSDPIYFSPIGQALYAFGFVDDTSIRTVIPSVFQLYPNDEGYLTVIDGAIFSLSYSTLLYDTPIDDKVLGLIDRYHQKYLSIIHNDKFVNVQAAMNLDEYRADWFRQPRVLNIDGQRTKAWQVSTDSFEPLDSNLADVVLALDYERIDDGQGYTETANTDKPLLTIGYTFILTK